MVMRRTRAPVFEGDFPVKVNRAKILSVDKVKWIATVQPEGSGLPIEGVPIEPMAVGGKDGGGSYFMPKAGGLVWLMNTSKDTTPIIMGAATAPKQTDDGDDNEDPNDRRMNRPVLNEGDIALAVSDQGHLIMRRGGMLEMGGGPDCKTIYIPLTNIIRQFSEGWEHHTGGGLLSFLARDQDQVYRGDDEGVTACSSQAATAGSTPPETNTPVEFQLKVKEFAEDGDEYAVDLRLGRIEDEDDEKVVGGDLGACVVRFNVNDRYTVWVDRTGNFQSKTAGVVKNEYISYVEHVYNKKFRQQILGLMDSEMQGRSLHIKSTDNQVVGRDRSVDIGGTYWEKVGKSVTRKGGKLTEDYRGIKRTSRGGVTESIHGAHEQAIGSNRNVVVGGDSAEVVSRNKSVTVGKAESNPNPLDVSYQIYLYNGVFAVHDAAGKIVFSTGTPLRDTALATVRLKPSGSVELVAGLAGVSLEVNLTGMRLKTPGGEISIDNLGTVELGQGPVRGAVLTTLTMPACFVTGVPTVGCSAVKAGGIPQPALPPVSVPSTFVPDETP